MKRSLSQVLVFSMSLLVLTTTLLVCGVFGLFYLRGSWQQKTVLLKNDLPHSSVTRLYVEKSFFSEKLLGGPASYFAYPILLEADQQTAIASGGKHFCIAIGSLQRSENGFITTTGTETWLQLDLPIFTKEIQLSRIADYARKPCSYSFSETMDAHHWVIDNWVEEQAQGHIDELFYAPAEVGN